MMAPVSNTTAPSLTEPKRNTRKSSLGALKLVEPKLGEPKANLDRSDRTVALQALQMALKELGDGVTLVWWRRPISQLTGRVKPVSAFRDDMGRICRAVVYSLSRGGNERALEGVACRGVGGRWEIIS